MITASTKYQDSSAPVGAPVQDLRMQVQVIGEGPPLVLVGGGLTGWKSWEPHAERLAATRTVARLQPLNVQYGLEDRPLPEGYSARMESAALAATLDGLGWHEPLDLVAWSFGALITLDFALDYPERVRTLTLIEPPAVWVLPDRGVNDPDVRAESSFVFGNDVSEADLKEFLRAAGLTSPGTDPTGLPQWPVWMEHRRSLRGVHAAFNHHDDPVRLEAFDRPILLIMGIGTVPYNGRIRDTLSARLPHTHTIEMPAGHAPHIVSMDRFLAELAEFHEGAGATGHQVTSKDGTVISYQKRGTGPTLLFVHGTTADHRSWSKVSPHLEQHLTVCAMDRRGRGSSGDASEYDFMREVEDVAAVVEAIGEPVSLFGHSFGGLVSLEAALRIDQVDRLILYEPAIPIGVPMIAGGVLEEIQALVGRGELEEAMEVFMREVAQLPEEELATYRQTPLWEARLPLIATVSREMAIEGRYMFDAERFARFQVPTLLLLGEESPPVYRQSIETLDAALPNSEVVILPGQQHIVHHMNPELLARALMRFLVD